MLEALLTSGVSEGLTLSKTLMILGSSLTLGLFISLIYIATHKREGFSRSYTITLIMMPAIISIIILLIGSNVARAFSLAGAFSLIRFRSAAADPKDISYVFFTLAVGLACGMGYVGYAALFAVVLCLVMLVIEYLNYARPRSASMQLKITVPENMNYQSLFDDILNRYTDSWQLNRVKTTDFGTLFNLAYRIQLKTNCSQKEFLDELRCRNGNLDISLTMSEFEDRSYY